MRPVESFAFVLCRRSGKEQHPLAVACQRDSLLQQRILRIRFTKRIAFGEFIQDMFRVQRIQKRSNLCRLHARRAAALHARRPCKRADDGKRLPPFHRQQRVFVFQQHQRLCGESSRESVQLLRRMRPNQTGPSAAHPFCKRQHAPGAFVQCRFGQFFTHRRIRGDSVVDAAIAGHLQVESRRRARGAFIHRTPVAHHQTAVPPVLPQHIS
ncbi:hypothetical protein SDC9_128482 [bioreactor metagenome]|uniref:Uncharacterized protein n=1 Tax=bioreactor metagenome TaxID=1076179 RepID=A0A645CWZ4_9ZZZZ